MLVFYTASLFFFFFFFYFQPTTLFFPVAKSHGGRGSLSLILLLFSEFTFYYRHRTF